jgi:rubrerythrin
MGALARHFGAEPRTPSIEAVPDRTPFEIALENAVEGCVRETFGAVVGAHQALRAGDEQVAAAMRGVAEDEIRHAELSWALAAWLEPQLTDEERLKIDQAKRDAVMTLRKQASEAVDPALVVHAGMPDAETAVGMVERLAVDIWA